MQNNGCVLLFYFLLGLPRELQCKAIHVRDTLGCIVLPVSLYSDASYLYRTDRDFFNVYFFFYLATVTSFGGATYFVTHTAPENSRNPAMVKLFFIGEYSYLRLVYRR